MYRPPTFPKFQKARKVFSRREDVNTMNFLTRMLLTLPPIFLVPITFFKYFFFTNIYLNDYLNPYTLTFKNPKTLQMFNIIVLYHYVMTFLVGILIFTFIFIFLSFFRTYFYFNFAPYYQVEKTLFKDLVAYFKVAKFNVFDAYSKVSAFISSFLIEKKRENMDFYRRDIKSSMTDQVTHAPLLEFL